MQKLAVKLIEAMKLCKYVMRNGINTFHKYKYATSADVLEKVNAAFTKQGIATIVVPDIIKDEAVTTAKGTVEHLVTVKIEVTLVDKDSGETAVFRGFGSGQDATDKAVMKAQTAALKYAYMLSLAMATGDDPEADEKTDENMNVSKSDVPTRGKVEVKTDNPQPILKGSSSGIRKPPMPKGGYRCYDCGAKITDKVAEFSFQKYGKCLCMECQKSKSSS